MAFENKLPDLAGLPWSTPYQREVKALDFKASRQAPPALPIWLQPGPQDSLH